ncbi:MAG: glycosyltransferase family 39 protein [Xenococcaceae cyanobacterium]
MNLNIMLKQKSFLFAWRLLIVFLLVLGIFFRFANLDRKIYWFDETYTSLRISGYREAEVIDRVYDKNPIAVEDLMKYQRLNRDRGVSDTIVSLAKEDPHHSPLYYVLVRFWVQWFGNSVATIRSCSVLLSLLAFPAIYWLSIELFASKTVAWTAMAILAVSPFQILYAQEARQYSLWTTTILLASAALLRAMRVTEMQRGSRGNVLCLSSRTKIKLAWIVYTFTLALGLYTFVYTTFVAIGHFVYVMSRERWRLTKTVIAYLISSAIGFLLFVPWLLVIVRGLSQIQRSTAQFQTRPTFMFFVKAWLGRLGYVFVDLNPYSPESKLSISLLAQYGFGMFVIVLVGYSLYFLCRQTPQKIWLFVVTLIGGTFLGLFIPDLIFGGVRSTINRHIIPCFLGFQLSVAYLIADGEARPTVNRALLSFLKFKRQKIWHAIAIVIFSCGVFSAAISSNSVVWWNKGANYYVVPMAEIINRADRPLIISGDRTENRPLINVTGDVMSLSYLLKPQTYWQLFIEPNFPKIPSGYGEVFLYKSSESFRKNLESQGYKLKLIYEANNTINTNLFKILNK